MPITLLPPAPNRNDPTTFRVRMDDMLGALDQFVADANALESATSGQSARNRVHNGNFAVNQRQVSGTVTLAAGVYGHDRWKAGAGGCTYTFATSLGVTTLTITAGTLLQVLDGADITNGGHTVSWIGTAQGRIGAGSYAASGFAATLTGGSNANLEFGTGTLSRVQVEAGSAATGFERRPYQVELAICQRYLPVSSGPHIMGQSSATNAAYLHAQFAVQARVAPTGMVVVGGLSNFFVRNEALSLTAMTGGSLTFSLAGVDGGSFSALPASTVWAAAGASTSLYINSGRILWTGAEL